MMINALERKKIHKGRGTKMQAVGMEVLLDIEMGRKSLLKKAYSSRDLRGERANFASVSRKNTPDRGDSTLSSFYVFQNFL